jgi:preprotein translocase subunit YajC
VEQLFLPLLILVLAIPMFLSVRNQKKQARKQQELQNSIGVGDRVMTTSGLFGTVVSNTDDSVDIEIADGLVTTWLKAAVREKVNPTEDDSEGADDTSTVESTGGGESQHAETEQVEAQHVETEQVEAQKNVR